MSEQTRDEFVNQYKGPHAKKVARDLYDAMHPVGMHTNGPTYIRVEASFAMILLSRWLTDEAKKT